MTVRSVLRTSVAATRFTLPRFSRPMRAVKASPMAEMSSSGAARKYFLRLP